MKYAGQGQEKGGPKAPVRLFRGNRTQKERRTPIRTVVGSCQTLAVFHSGAVGGRSVESAVIGGRSSPVSPIDHFVGALVCVGVIEAARGLPLPVENIEDVEQQVELEPGAELHRVAEVQIGLVLRADAPEAVATAAEGNTRSCCRHGSSPWQ